jgi:hypothetical protein
VPFVNDGSTIEVSNVEHCSLMESLAQAHPDSHGNRHTVGNALDQPDRYTIRNSVGVTDRNTT